MKNFIKTIIILSIISITSCESGDNYKLKYVELVEQGDKEYRAHKLILSLEHINKLEYLKHNNFDSITIDDTLKIHNILIDENRLESIIKFIDSSNGKVIPEDEYYKNEIHLIGYRIGYFENYELIKSDYCVSKQYCSEFFENIQDYLVGENMKDVDSLLNNIYDLY